MQMSSTQLSDPAILKKRKQCLIEGKYFLLDQEPDWSQCLCGPILEKANEYHIYETDPGFSVTKPFGNIKEDSECFTRMCCICNRPFSSELRVKGDVVAVINRGSDRYRCCIESCPCLNNEVGVTDTKGQLIGKIEVPWWCCVGSKFACAEARLVVTDSKGVIIYYIESNYCQSSHLCPCFRCCYCPAIEYMVYDDLYLLVGKISNICNGVCYELFSKASKFGIEFPVQASDERKILLLSAAMYLSYLRYEGFWGI